MLGCAQQEIEAHVRGVTREQDTTTAIDSTTSQTHSAKTAVFGIFSTNGSAVWPRHHRKLRSHCHKSGGMTPFKAPTRRRHAVRGLRMAQNPHHHRHGEHRGHGEPGRSTHEQRQGAAIARQLARGLRQSKTLFAQQEPRRTPSVQNSPCSPEMAQFGAL